MAGLFSGSLGLGSALDAIHERKAFGLEKYEGVVLHADNGRDYVKDVDDELCDLVVYLRALLERYPDLRPIFNEDYRLVLRLLLRWRSAVPMLQALEA